MGQFEGKQESWLTRIYSANKTARSFDKLLLVTFFLLIFVSPLPFGSVQPGPLLCIQLTALVGFLLWCCKLTFCGDPAQLERFRDAHRESKQTWKGLPFFQRHLWLAQVFRLLTLGNWPKRNVAVTLVSEAGSEAHFPYYSILGFPVRKTGVEAVAILFLSLVLIQILPLPGFFIAIISPGTSDLYGSAARSAGIHPQFYTISLDAFTTVSKFLEYSAYFFLYLVVVNTVRTRRSYWLILCAIFASAVFQAIYGLFEFLSGHQHIFAYQKKFGLDAASGTFINRNHYAAYLEVSLPLLIALVIGRVSSLKAFGGKLIVRIGHALETRGSQVLLLVFMISLVAVALVFSLSRSGISFALIALLTFLFLYWRTREKLSGKTYLILGIGGSMALAVWIGLNPLLVRFTQISENWLVEGSRWKVWQDTFHIFIKFPILGTGAGTFEEIFPMYRSVLYQTIYRQAHNDYVQLLSEIGVGTLFLILTFFILLFQRLRKVSALEFSRLGIVQLAAFCSLLSLGLHSLTDFSLQIPAIAVLASIVTGLFFANDHLENKDVQSF